MRTLARYRALRWMVRYRALKPLSRPSASEADVLSRACLRAIARSIWGAVVPPSLLQSMRGLRTLKSPQLTNPLAQLHAQPRAQRPSSSPDYTMGLVEAGAGSKKRPAYQRHGAEGWFTLKPPRPFVQGDAAQNFNSQTNLPPMEISKTLGK